jgi:hypothetical protein
MQDYLVTHGLPVPLFRQTQQPWNSNYIGRSRSNPTGCGQIMGVDRTHKVGYGCAITAIAMVMKYYRKTIQGKTTDPGKLNDYLGQNGWISIGGWNNCGITNWQYVGRKLGLSIPKDLIKTPAATWAKVKPQWTNVVRNELKQARPVIAQVGPAMHFVVIVGLSIGPNGTANDFKINDPAGKASRLFARYQLVGLRTVR